MSGWDEALGAVTVNEAGPTTAGLPVGLPMPRDRELLFDRPEAGARPRGQGAPVPVPGPQRLVRGGRVERPRARRGPGALLLRPRPGPLPHRVGRAPARRRPLPPPRRPPRRRRQGRGRLPALPVPRLGVRRATGACVEIPYGDGTRIPARAAARAYPTLERNGMVWAWYHAEGGEPFYDVPEVDEFADPEWSDPVVRDFEIAVPAQDMAENNVDYAHFRYVHGTDAIPEDDFLVDGTYKRAVGMDGNFVREGYGLGLGVLRIANYVTFLSSTTPIDEESVHVRWVFTAPLSQRPRRGDPGRRLVLRRRQPGHPHLGEQGVPRPPGPHPVRAADHRPPPLGPAVLFPLRRARRGHRDRAPDGPGTRVTGPGRRGSDPSAPWPQPENVTGAGRRGRAAGRAMGPPPSSMWTSAGSIGVPGSSISNGMTCGRSPMHVYARVEVRGLSVLAPGGS